MQELVIYGGGLMQAAQILICLDQVTNERRLGAIMKWLSRVKEGANLLPISLKNSKSFRSDTVTAGCTSQLLSLQDDLTTADSSHQAPPNTAKLFLAVLY